jgi:plastocyanin
MLSSIKRKSEKDREMMKMSYRLLAGVVLGSLSISAFGGDITGKVTLKGAAPKERNIPFDPACSKARGGEKGTTRFYAADASGGLAEVFVTLKGIKGDFPVPSEPVVLDQVGCEYIPYIAGVRAGQKIVVKNSDPVFHNVHPTPRVKGNPEANKAQLPKGKDLEFVFNNAEQFLRFKCDVHAWMFSYVNVVDHPYFAVTGEDGSFTIKNVPPGEYEIEAIHRKSHAPKYQGVVQKVTVGADGATADFVVDITK